MKLPDKLTFKNTVHGTGGQGLAFYIDEDTAGLGIQRETRRNSRREPFVETWRCRLLVDRSFPLLTYLLEALQELTDEQVEAERARWPLLNRVDELGRSAWTSKCWRHRDRPATIQAHVQTSWIPGDGVIAALCAECAAGVSAADVVEVVNERRADVAARRGSSS